MRPTCKKSCMSDLSLKLIMRKLCADRVYTVIKILGLTVGMASALLAVLYVRDENSFDRFHAKADRLYRITTILNTPLNGGSKVMGATGQVQGPAFKSKIPEIEDYVRVMGGLSTNFIANDKALWLTYIYADTGFFNDFTFPLVYGIPSSSLEVANSVVITEGTALKFFGKRMLWGRPSNLKKGTG